MDIIKDADREIFEKDYLEPTKKLINRLCKHREQITGNADLSDGLYYKFIQKMVDNIIGAENKGLRDELGNMSDEEFCRYYSNELNKMAFEVTMQAMNKYEREKRIRKVKKLFCCIGVGFLIGVIVSWYFDSNIYNKPGL